MVLQTPLVVDAKQFFAPSRGPPVFFWGGMAFGLLVGQPPTSSWFKFGFTAQNHGFPQEILLEKGFNFAEFCGD